MVACKSNSSEYRREAFGIAWQDIDHNGCTQRQDVLKRDLSEKTFAGKCKVAGVLIDPYTNTVVHSSKVDIDHVVPLKEAWDSGAKDWTESKRIQFANDIGNLLAVSATSNRSKSDKSPDKWMPQNKQFHCEYLKRYKNIKSQWNLSYDNKELKFINDNLVGC